MRGDPRERGLEPLERRGPAAVTDHARARAEAAIDGAAIGREEQDAIGVATNEVGSDLVLDLAEGVDHVAVHLARLERTRHALAPDGTRGVVAIAEREVVRRDGDRQALELCAARALDLVGGQLEHLREVFHAARGLAELRVPVVRPGRGRAGVRALARAFDTDESLGRDDACHGSLSARRRQRKVCRGWRAPVATGQPTRTRD